MGKRNGSTMEIGGESPTNGGQEAIEMTMPYCAEIKIEGVAPILFHRWNVEQVAEKAAAAKGSKAKKSDNVESYLYRNDKNEICIPGEYLRMAIIGAAKFKQDPRSPRKSAMDLVKAGIMSLTDLASTGAKDYYEDRRRVQVQRNGITRVRPALREGWTASFVIQVNTPEYISPAFLNGLIADAGRLIGIADFRPSFGRFQVVGFKLIKD